MEIQLIRHSTIVLSIEGKKILVDPMFAQKGSLKSIPTVKDGKKENNPTVDLPFKTNLIIELLKKIDAVLITHMHFDHFFETSEIKIPRTTTIICQKCDEKRVQKLGFRTIIVVNNNILWNNIEIKTVKSNHGGFFIRQFMIKNSGFLIKSRVEPTVYITGDTVYCKHVENNLKENPDITIVNAGGALLPFGRSITMDKSDIKKLCAFNKNTKIVAIHMDAVNHCRLTRDSLKSYLIENNLLSRVKIPIDGEIIEFFK